MKVSRGIIWEVESTWDAKRLEVLLSEGWEPYAVTQNAQGGRTHYLRRQTPA